MKTKKVFLAIIFMLILSLIFGGIINSSYALTKEEIAGMSLTRTTPLKLGIVQIRESGYGYMSGSKTVFKVVSYPLTGEANNTNIDWSNSIYCIKGGPGFSVEGNNLAEIQYDIFRDMNGDKTDSYLSKYISLIPTNNYGSLLWLLDNIYLPKNANKVADKLALLQAAENYDSNEMDAEDAKTLLTDDDIEVIQQAAIWHFTNMDDGTGFDVGNTISPYITKTERTPGKYTSIDQSEYTSLGTTQTTSNKTQDDADYRLQYAGALYGYLINTAATKTSYTQNTISAPLSINNNATSEISGSNYVIGPFKITKENDNAYTNFAATIKDQNGANITNYTMLDSNKAQTTKTIEQLIGENFYIQIPLTNDTISKVKVSVTANYKGNSTINLIASSQDTQFTTTQPLAIIDREDKSLSLEEPVDITKPSPDFALRKFITTINNVTVSPSREPQVDVTNLNKIVNGNLVTTAIYNHTKNPIVVDTDDVVVYTIRVYNEGIVDGYVNEITDHLPAELEFLPDNAINKTYGWVVDTINDSTGRTIKTGYLSFANNANTTSENKISAFNGTKLDYRDVQIACKVKLTDTSIKITNIADITEEANSSGTKIDKDRDSTPKNVVLPSDTNLPGYKDNEINNSYVPGQEDDDDFEKLRVKEFDLSLRKFITKVNDKDLKDASGNYIREPQVDTSKLNTIENGNRITTATYNHSKTPVGVQIGDIVVYTLRIYNEGETDGYAKEITDHLPAELEFIVNSTINTKYRWLLDGNDDTLGTIRTDYLSKNQDDKNLLKAYDGTKLDYKDIQVECKVKSTAVIDKKITNIADITNDSDKNGNEVIDRDSTPKNVVLPSDENLPNYKDNEINKSYVPGQEDDDDFEKLVIKQFDLSLRKFITKVNDMVVSPSREPQVDVTNLNKTVDGKVVTTAKYTHPKDPVPVATGDIVTYTIRMYNEGEIDGYVQELKDDIPEGLEFLPDNALNKEYRWVMYDKDGKVTKDVTKAVEIRTDYLSKEQEKISKDNLILAYDETTMKTLSYKDVKVNFKVVEPDTSTNIITNTAEISKDADDNGNDVTDRDSTPDNNIPTEDDIDVDHVKLTYFDLALRKFITEVEGKVVLPSREPVVDVSKINTVDKDGKLITTATYTHPKDPIDVVTGNIVTYTIRVYNEGTRSGYAKQIKDDIPEGLEFLPDNELNKEYRWVMYDEEGNVTEDLTKAVDIRTDYLSKEQEKTSGANLINAFDNTKGLSTVEPLNPDYKDVKVNFKVTEPETSDRILINTAQISNDSDENGKDVIDRDSTPDNDKPGEDDIDIDKVKVKYFDLSLKKWVTQAIVTENGKTTVQETGHTGDENPEPIVKVELYRKNINKVTVKFRYKIKVTNEGEIAGYAKEVTDYVPKGLKFVQADNPDWYIRDNDESKIATKKLENTLLQPGESATVEVLLTWVNGNDNMGVMTNIAEISKDYNDSHTPDIDSTPDNKVPGEDDIDDAPVLLGVSTGSVPMYLGLVGAVLITITGGVILIKKYVIG